MTPAAMARPPSRLQFRPRQPLVPWAALLAGLLLGMPLAAPPLAQAQAAARRITVAEGDTLEQLAERHGVSQEALIRLNGIGDPDQLQVGQTLLLPASSAARPTAPLPQAPLPLAPPPPIEAGGQPAAALLLTPAERRDRAELALREQAGLVRWKWFNATAVDWAGWKLHAGGVRITLVKPAAADLGVRGSAATAVAVQCESLRHTWRIDGTWQPWEAPLPGSVAQRIVLDLCSNTLDGPAVPLPPPPP